MASLLTALGSLLMAHAAYSTLHYRSILQDLGDVQEPIPPLDVYVEVILSFLLLLIGQMVGAGKLQPVELLAKDGSAGSSRVPLVAPAYRTRKFDIYEHRGKLLKGL